MVRRKPEILSSYDCFELCVCVCVCVCERERERDAPYHTVIYQIN